MQIFLDYLIRLRILLLVLSFFSYCGGFFSHQIETFFFKLWFWCLSEWFFFMVKVMFVHRLIGCPHVFTASVVDNLWSLSAGTSRHHTVRSAQTEKRAETQISLWLDELFVSSLPLFCRGLCCHCSLRGNVFEWSHVSLLIDWLHAAAQLSLNHLQGGVRHGNNHIAGMFRWLAAAALAASPSPPYEVFPANPLLPWDVAASVAVYVQYRDGLCFFFFLHCWDLQINICFHQRQRLLFLFRPDPVTSCLTRCLVSPQSPASTVTLNQSELRGIRPWVTTAPRWWAANWSPALLWTVKKMKMRAGDTAVISVFTVKMQCPAMRMISQSN